jgi:hypothetical protein
MSSEDDDQAVHITEYGDENQSTWLLGDLRKNHWKWQNAHRPNYWCCYTHEG